PNQSFGPVSLDRAAELFRRRDPKPTRRATRRTGEQEHGQIPAMNPGPALIDLLKICAPANPLCPREGIVQAIGFQLFAADREPLSALGASALQDEPAVLGAHSDQKPVRPLAMAIV